MNKKITLLCLFCFLRNNNIKHGCGALFNGGKEVENPTQFEFDMQSH